MSVWMLEDSAASLREHGVLERSELEPVGLGWTDPKLETEAVTAEETCRIRRGRAWPGMHSETLPDTRDSGKRHTRSALLCVLP